MNKTATDMANIILTISTITLTTMVQIYQLKKEVVRVDTEKDKKSTLNIKTNTDYKLRDGEKYTMLTRTKQKVE